MESVYTVGFRAGRPRRMKVRALPHSPARERPALSWLVPPPVACARVTRFKPSLSWAMPRVAVRKPLRNRCCSGVGGRGGAGDGSACADSARVESGAGGTGCCALRAVAATNHSTARQRIGGPLSSEWKPGYNVTNDRSRNLASEPDVRRPCRCARPLFPAGRRGAAAARIRRRRRLPARPSADGDQRVFIYFGPRMDAPPADPYEGSLLYDEPGVRAYIFAQRVHAIAHFLRATQGSGAVISLLGRRAPELRHIRRWLQVLFSEPFAAESSTQLLAGWFATAGAGVLFIPPHPNEPYSYYEVGLDT